MTHLLRAFALTSLMLALAGGVHAGRHAERKAERQADPAARGGDTAPDPAIPACGPQRCLVTVAGGHLQRDGRPWTPKGVVLTGLVAPEPYLRGIYARSREAWGPQLLRQLQDIGVDTLRFNVSAAGLDPDNPMPDRRMGPEAKRVYLAQIVEAVELGARYGMNSIVTITSGDVTGASDSERVPGQEAVRGWRVLAPLLAKQPSVVFNAFNEPDYGGTSRIDTDPKPWQEWRAGYQLMVDAIRASGARQPIILDGLDMSRVWRRLTEAQVPHDPLAQLVYDIHPFPTDSGQHRKTGKAKIDYHSPEHIEHWLGGWCERHACIASAFYSGSAGNPAKAHCYDARNAPAPGLDSARITDDFLDYFDRRQIGVLAFAGDWPFRVFDRPGQPGARLTGFPSAMRVQGCAQSERMYGPGERLRDHWLRLRRQEGAPR